MLDSDNADDGYGRMPHSERDQSSSNEIYEAHEGWANEYSVPIAARVLKNQICFIINDMARLLDKASVHPDWRSKIMGSIQETIDVIESLAVAYEVMEQDAETLNRLQASDERAKDEE